MSKEKKAQTIDRLQETFSKCSVGILTNYRGLLTSEITVLRRKLRELGIEYRVVKNTLARFAVERAGRDDLVGFFEGPVAIAFSYGDNTPTITIDKKYLTVLRAEPEKKFGLSEAQRMQIFREIVQAEDDATNAAMSKYPNDVVRQIDYEGQQVEANKENLRKKYRLSKQEFDEIGIEGIKKKWPMP